MVVMCMSSQDRRLYALRSATVAAHAMTKIATQNSMLIRHRMSADSAMLLEYF